MFLLFEEFIVLPSESVILVEETKYLNLIKKNKIKFGTGHNRVDRVHKENLSLLMNFKKKSLS